MTEGVAELFRLIPERDVSLPSTEGAGVTVQSLLAALGAIEQMGNRELNLALLHVLLRVMETFVLADHGILDIARYPDAYLGRADDVIRARIEAVWGVPAPDSLVNHVRRCVTGTMARVGEKGSISPAQVVDLFRRAAREHPRREIRCSVCGYHFRRDDLGSARIKMAEEEGLVFAKEFDPGRLNDDMKPHEFARLEVDHVVPEEGLGWNAIDNLQVACQFCNNGRLIFRRALEPLSTMVAGALSTFPESRTHRLTRQVIVVSALLHAGGRCNRCAATRVDREMTAQLCEDGRHCRMWCVPWNLEVTCYRCRDQTT